MARAAAGRFGWLYGGGLRGGGLSGGGPRADGLLRCRLLRRSLLALRRLALVLEAAAGARAVWLGLGLGEALAEIGRAHVCPPVTNAHLGCRLLLEKTTQATPHTTD